MGIFGKTNPFQALQYIGAAMQDAAMDSQGGHVEAINASRMAQAQRSRQQEVLADLMARMGPQYEESPAPQVGLPTRPMPGPVDQIQLPRGMFGASAPPQEPAEPYTYQPPKRISDGLNINSPELGMLALQAKASGVDIDTLLDVMKAQQPNVKIGPDGTPYNEKDASVLDRRFRNPTNVNGWIQDMNNPDNEGQYFPQLPEGMSPDGHGGVAYPRGMVPQLAAREGAVAEAKARGTAPYEFVSTPTPTGAPQVQSKATAAGGVFTGQSPADAVRANSLAAGDAERANTIQDRAAGAGRQLAALDEMEALLPDVISGFGSDVRINTARAMALAGSEDAKRKVAATETFINQGRILVAGIIKTFGANPTEGERKFAEKMSGADAELSPETLAQGIKLQRQRIYRDLQAAQGESSAIRPQGQPTGPRKTGRNGSRIVAVE